MKKTCVLCVLFVLLSPLLLTAQDQEEAPQAQKARVIVEKARIYLESNPYSFVIDTVSRGTIVTLFQTGQKNKKWLYISYYSKKRMAQVTGFIDINLVEMINEKPKKPELSEEIEEKSVTEKQDESTIQSEAEGTAEGKEEIQEEQTQARLEKKEPTQSEKELSDIQKELTAQGNKLKEIEKQSGEEEVRDQTKSEEAAEIKKESEGSQEKEAAEKDKLLTESAQEEKESVEEEQKIEQAVKQEIGKEMEVKTEQKKEAEEETESEKKGTEAVKELEKQDEEMKAQMEGEEKNQEAKSPEEQKEKPGEEIIQEVLTKITIKVRKANIRLMPSLKSDVIHQLPFGVDLKPLAKSGNWYRVNLPPNPDGIILSGYIHDSIVNETFEKQVLAPPEPEEPSESELEILEEEPEPAPEPSQEIQSAVRTGKTVPIFWIGGGAGYTMPSESNFEKGINFGGTLGFGVTRHLAVELRVPYYQSNVTGSIGGLSAGQFQTLSFALSVQARYPIKNRIIPYIVAGGDYHLNKFTLDNDIVNSWNAMGFNIEESVDHTFGFHFGGGIDLFILRSLALNFDVRYSTATLKGDWRLADTISQVETTGPIENIKLNFIQAGIGVKFFLNR
jgi:opacity protein-like surface antigen